MWRLHEDSHRLSIPLSPPMYCTCFMVNAPECLTPSVKASQKPPDSRKRQARPGGARQARETCTWAQYERPKHPTCGYGGAEVWRHGDVESPFHRYYIQTQNSVHLSVAPGLGADPLERVDPIIALARVLGEPALGLVPPPAVLTMYSKQHMVVIPQPCETKRYHWDCPTRETTALSPESRQRTCSEVRDTAAVS